MKRLIAVVLSLALLVSAFPAVAEGDWFGSLFGDIMKEVTDIANEVATDAAEIWNDVTDVAVEVWSDLSDVTMELWGEVKVFASDAWDDMQDAWKITKEYAAEAWNVTAEALGDAASDVAEFLSEVWVEVAATADGTWKWMKNATTETTKSVKSWIDAKGNQALDSLKKPFGELLGEMGLDAEQADKVWKTIVSYAKEHDLSTLSVVKIVLPYLARMSEMNPETLTTDTVSGFLMSILEKLSVTDQRKADELLKLLQQELGKN